MLSEDEFFRTHTEEEIWQRYCGFLDLSVDEFMEIQQRLLLDQIDLVANSFLGNKVMKGNKPRSVEEFRHMVPLTVYQDYEPYLSEQDEDVLAEKPIVWAHTSGRGGKFKWIPYTERFLKSWSRNGIAALLLSSASRRNEIRISPGERLLINVPSRPYCSGLIVFRMADDFSFRFLPPPKEAEEMEFQDKIEAAFKLALKMGADFVFCAISSTLLKVGENIGQQSNKMKFSSSMLHPLVISRLLRGWLHSKQAGRSNLLPSDLWSLKGIFAVGADTTIYKNKIKEYWGITPLELYVSTEVVFTATQSWNKKWLTFFPNSAFLEFIPEDEWIKSQEDKKYQPATVLINEVEEGKIYEMVMTSFYGMPLLRYRIGDLIKIVSLEDDETGCKLPQMVFQSRINDIIDVFGYARLDEKTVWQAIVDTGVEYVDWVFRKEFEHGKPVLQLYLEPKPKENITAAKLADLLHEQLQHADPFYKEVVRELEVHPLRVTLLTRGAFQRYYEEKRKAGADLAHLKPPHMSASDDAVQILVGVNRE